MIHEQNVLYHQVEKISPYAGNARTHSDKQISQVARSIDKFGFITLTCPQ